MTTVLQSTANNKSPNRNQKVTNKQFKENAEKPISITTDVPSIKLNEKVTNEETADRQKRTTRADLQDCAQFLNKTKTLLFALEKNFWACDAKWTLFVSAAFSYRYETVLHPFPPQFATENSCYDIDSLISVIKDTPKLRIILQSLMDPVCNEPSVEVINLLYWVLIVMREPALRLVEDEEVNSLMKSVDEKANTLRPTHVFEVNALTGFHSAVSFRERTKNAPLKVAFMGNKFDNYFSILFNGFKQQTQQQLQQQPQQQEQTHELKLTTDLQTSLQSSPYGAAWGASQCGSIISCTAICEIAINPNEDKIVTNKNEKTCVDIHLSNPENIRLRYLIFYGRRFPHDLLLKPRFFSWLFNHKFSFSFWSYLLLLVSISIANSDSGEGLKLYVSKKFDLLFDFCRKMVTKEPTNFV